MDGLPQKDGITRNIAFLLKSSIVAAEQVGVPIEPVHRMSLSRWMLFMSCTPPGGIFFKRESAEKPEASPHFR